MTTKILGNQIANFTIDTEQLSNTATAAFAKTLAPKILYANVASNTYSVLDDTAVNVGGGFIVITGSEFQSGAQVLIDTVAASAVTYVNSTTIRAQIPARSAASYNLYVVNPDGGVGLKVAGVTYSGTPTWVTESPLPSAVSNTAFSGSFSATGATSYANTTILPTGFNLLANGYYFGTISVGSETTYSFNIRATDAELQDSDKTFSLTAINGISVEYLIVSGGGGGGATQGSGTSGSGGGAGGLLSGTLLLNSGTPYSITVGAAGSGGIYNATSTGGNGSNSAFFNITSTRGGGGADGRANAQISGNSGGSGAGGAGGGGGSPSLGATGASGIPGQGFAGGSGGLGSTEGRMGGSGGGGGAGGLGSNGENFVAGVRGGNGGAGGLGVTWTNTGPAKFYAGGGGGGSGWNNNSTRSAGGSNIGGSGGASSGDGTGGVGTTNTGSGGGGGGGSGPNGGAGGSGVVVLAVPTPQYPGSAPGAVVTTPPAAPGKTVLTFNSSGTYTA